MIKWNFHEINFLRKNYRIFTYEELSRKLNRPLYSINWKVRDLDLKKGRWNEKNRLNRNKIVNKLKEFRIHYNRSPSIREVPIALKSACQRHFGNFNNAKKAANLEIKQYIKNLPKGAYKPSKELAYIVGVLLGDGHFRYQHDRKRTSYVIVFATKDKDIMDYFACQFKKWSNFFPKLFIRKGGWRKFPNGNISYYQKFYCTQISFKEAWTFLTEFKRDPLYCIDFFSEKYYPWIIKGLWDAEGSINFKTNDCLRISFTNTDDAILSLYRRLLNQCCIYYYLEKGTENKTNVQISDIFNVLKFIKVIDGITIKRKEHKIKTRLSQLKKDYKQLDLTIDFNHEVYEIVKRIPSGYVSTYGEVALALRNPRAYRAVGNALHKNPYAPVVPCHRVINADGSLGGFASGVKKKIALLEAEGIEVKKNKVDLERYLFKLS